MTNSLSGSTSKSKDNVVQFSKYHKARRFTVVFADERETVTDILTNKTLSLEPGPGNSAYYPCDASYLPDMLPHILSDVKLRKNVSLGFVLSQNSIPLLSTDLYSFFDLPAGIYDLEIIVINPTSQEEDVALSNNYFENLTIRHAYFNDFLSPFEGF